jgi:hypothetical protein
MDALYCVMLRKRKEKNSKEKGKRITEENLGKW